MNMMNKCAKFHKDSPSGKKVKFNLARAIELSETAVLCTTLYRNLMQAIIFGGTFDQRFLWIFLWNFHRRCLSTRSIPWCKKDKNDQKLKSRGPALKGHLNEKIAWSDYGSIHKHRNLNETERSVFARYWNFNAPKNFKITVLKVSSRNIDQP